MIGKMFDQFIWWTGRRCIFEGGSLRFCFCKKSGDLAVNSMVIYFGSFSFDGSEFYKKVSLPCSRSHNSDGLCRVVEGDF